MIQRYIFNAIQNGLAALAADPSILDDIFCNIYGLGSDEVAGIKTYFANTTINLQQGYAHVDAKMPLLAIVMAQEQMSDFFLGDAAGISDAPMGSDTFGADETGAVWESNYQVLCYAEHPDVVSYLYEVVKSALLVNDDYLVDNGVMEPILSGMDLVPDPRYLPEHLFCRVLGLRCKRAFIRVDKNSKFGKAFKITGMFVPANSPYDNGGVKTLVTPYDGTSE